jgi:hypothetical protein
VEIDPTASPNKEELYFTEKFSLRREREKKHDERRGEMAER